MFLEQVLTRVRDAVDSEKRQAILQQSHLIGCHAPLMRRGSQHEAEDVAAYERRAVAELGQNCARWLAEGALAQAEPA